MHGRAQRSLSRAQAWHSMTCELDYLNAGVSACTSSLSHQILTGDGVRNEALGHDLRL